jgi:hypothetical protein
MVFAKKWLPPVRLLVLCPLDKEVRRAIVFLEEGKEGRKEGRKEGKKEGRQYSC